MYFFKYIFLVFITISDLFALTLQTNYETQGRDIHASEIYKDVPKDFILFSYDDNEYIYHSNQTEIAQIFKKHGLSLKFDGARYITFQQKSTIDIQPIVKLLTQEFTSKYPNINIKSLKVFPRAYLTSLPKEYSLKLQKQNLYQNHSTFAIVTPDHKMYFFDYTLDATLDVVVSTKKIQRHEKLGLANTKLKNVQFLNFKGMPLYDATNHQYQSKFSLKSDYILTQNDVEPLSVVHRNDIVNAFIEDGRVSISFEAVAQQDGKVGDTITIRKQDGKELRAKVVDMNRVEIE